MIFIACYHPLYGLSTGCINPSTGKQSIIVSGQKLDKLYSDRYVKKIPIPCGNCIGCRLDKSRQWADRMMLELDHSKTAIFVTLTYDDDHVHRCGTFFDGSPSYTLVKKDVQDFMKSLRGRKQFLDRQIRYYIAGEYGENTLRPHYHGILFGIDLSDFEDLEVVGTNEFGQIYYSSDYFTSLWSNGFTSISSVSWQTCAYVARYVTKKLNGDFAFVYDMDGRLPEFALMSRRPGLSGYFFLDHPEFSDLSHLPISDRNGVRVVRNVPLPSYLLESLELTQPDIYAKVKEDRAKFASDRQLLELQQTDLDLVSYLVVKERNFHERTKKLRFTRTKI